ncbi:hypothetical protein JYB88_09655 [Shewanella cyperi]|uniref:Uncharacterized protein n=1 Tax=Shewanella cyperi TaxID=2814292 RepID=A0A974XJT2_9GAMM|nr:hypothetical protein [Shewanella cyperi]QSX28568.1 hypothetical protein JYB88_09655 [Shewanella cyperi]
MDKQFPRLSAELCCQWHGNLKLLQQLLRDTANNLDSLGIDPLQMDVRLAELMALCEEKFRLEQKLSKLAPMQAIACPISVGQFYQQLSALLADWQQRREIVDFRHKLTAILESQAFTNDAPRRSPHGQNPIRDNNPHHQA